MLILKKISGENKKKLGNNLKDYPKLKINLG